MSSQPLLVPIQVDALVVTSDALAAGHFKRWRPDFRNLIDHQDPEDAVLEDFTNPKWHCGMYLHWRLPESLCEGKQQPDGSLAFPKIPNRWLVIRTSGENAAARTVSGAWVVESDYLDSQHPDPVDGMNEGTSPYLLTRINGRDISPPQKDSLGSRTVGIDPSDWKERDPDGELFLDILGPGLPTFSAFQPYNENVLSFHDSSADWPSDNVQNPDEKWTLSYCVLGWYSNAAYDPARAKDAKQALESLRWKLQQPDAAGAGSVYYGTVLALNGSGAGEAVNRPSAASVNIAIGSNVDDAWSALPPTDSPKAGPGERGTAGERRHQALAALLAGTCEYLNTPDGPVKTAFAQHAAGFGAAPTSPQWSLTDPRTPGPTQTPDAQPPSTDDLADLNHRQAQLRQADAALAQARQRLADLWRLKGISQIQGETENAKALEAQLRHALEDATRQRDAAATLRQDVARQQASVQQTAQAAGLSLTSSPAAPYEHPQDPTILLQGPGIDQPLVPEGPLSCRLPDELVTVLPGLPVTDRVDPPYTDLLPEHLRSLAAKAFAEFTALDQAAHHPVPDQDAVSLLQHLLTAPEHNPTAQALSPHTRAWKPPWSPLLLEWKGRCAPIPYTSTEHKPLWSFNGTHYAWNGSGDHAPGTLGGRLSLTPLPGFVASRKTDHIARNRSEDITPAYRRFSDTANRSDMLSQSLQGLNAWFLQRSPMPYYLPSPDNTDETDRAVAQQLTETTPGTSTARTVRLPQPAADPARSGFQPVRAGQIYLEEVTLIDRFGQTASLMLDQTRVYTNSPPASDKVVKDMTSFRSKVVQLPPRLLHPARLCIDAVDPDDDRNLAPDVPDIAPTLAGWILPNRLDHSLVLYTGTGMPLSEYRHGADPAQAAHLTLPLPAGRTLDSNTTLDKVHAFLDGLSTTALEDLITLIDAGLTTTSRTDQDTAALALLAGRPLALLRLRLAIELDGPPPGPAVPGTTPSDTLTAQWPLRLGAADLTEDGLIGYFLDDHYDQLRTPHPVPAECAVLKHLPADDPDLTVPCVASPLPATTGRFVTVLVDPWQKLHAVTDILPTGFYRIPELAVRTGLDALSIPFSTDPLLTPPDPDQNTIRMPKPSAFTGQWQWAQRASATQWSSRPNLTPPTADAAFPPDPAQARAGFLQLLEAFTRHSPPS
ncbi:hypothetical protein [Streptomyces iconiensis]|uniref:Uncharacterized protein n=1 Tax=Streptomyces iconiensis TaxID=1384038 RepID=A0ABT7A4L5_9ACTN|nr:hypothetical protein [Streptomyces iconiensis]MDJ1136251.1 hypothetical protein [Streptomyces iconiensis]